MAGTIQSGGVVQIWSGALVDTLVTTAVLSAHVHANYLLRLVQPFVQTAALLLAVAFKE